MKRNGGLAKTADSTSIQQKLFRFVLVYCLYQILLPIFFIILIIKGNIRWSGLRKLYKVVSAAHSDPIELKPNASLISKVWKLNTAKHYIGNLEWQFREGYCAQTTIRCILKSFKSFPTHMIPEQTGGTSEPIRWTTKIQDLMEQVEKNRKENEVVPSIKTDIIHGEDVDYETFLIKLRKALPQDNSRVGINYLRPALVGFKKPSFVPVHILLAFISGHFSPILGLIEEEQQPPLVAVFDVNSAYGMYLVEASKLYQAILHKDFTTKKSRAIVKVSEEEK